MRIWSSTDRPWLLWVLCWSFGLRRFTRYSISAFQSETGHTAPQWCIAPGGLVRSTYTLWRYPLLAKWWWRGQHLPFHCLSVNPLRKADLYGSVVGLFKHTYYELIVLACVNWGNWTQGLWIDEHVHYSKATEPWTQEAATSQLLKPMHY